MTKEEEIVRAFLLFAGTKGIELGGIAISGFAMEHSDFCPLLKDDYPNLISDFMAICSGEVIMKFFELTQKEYLDWFTPDAVNTMIIRANTEDDARALADKNEQEHRDGAQKWDRDHADCQILTLEGESEIILTS